MSHSQFHSISLFILRHAWLNLWDKHMTTGRINQVTTFHPHTPQGCDTRYSQLFKVAFSVRSSSMVNSNKSDCNYQRMLLQPGQQTHWGSSLERWQVKLILSPEISQVSDTSPLVIWQGSRPSEVTAYNWHTLSHGGFPSGWIKLKALPWSASSPPFPHHICKQPWKSCLSLINWTNKCFQHLTAQANVPPKLVHQPDKGQVLSIARSRTS